MSKKFELKVGAFVLTGLALSLIAILVLGGKQNFFTSVTHYHTHFSKVDGLVTGAKVVLGGLQIGSVSDVDFDPSTRDIKVSYQVESKYGQWIRKDSTVEIVTQGVLGDKYLSIIAGDIEQPELQNDDEIPPGKSKDFSQVLNQGDKLVQRLTSATESLDQALSALNRKNRLENILNNLEGITQKVNQDLEGTPLKSALKSMNQILDKINSGQGTLGAFVNDPSLYDDTKSLVGQVNRNRILRNLIRQSVKESENFNVEPTPDPKQKK